MAREVDAWVRKVGIGQIDWSRDWSRKTTNVRANSQYEWTIRLKLTARIGKSYTIYTRITPKELQDMDFSEEQLAEILASYVEFQLARKASDDEI